MMKSSASVNESRGSEKLLKSAVSKKNTEKLDIAMLLVKS